MAADGPVDRLLERDSRRACCGTAPADRTARGLFRYLEESLPDMKRVYDDRYLDRASSRRAHRDERRLEHRRSEHRPQKAKRSWIGSFNVKNFRVWAAALVLLLTFIFFVSLLLTAADANMGPAVAQSVHEIKAPTGAKPAAPGVWANAAVLTDAESGRVLYDKAGHVKLYVASTTKMMTALVVREHKKLSDKIVIGPEATQVGEQGMDLTPGETLTVEQLLNALLIQSANDVAYALAQGTAGSIDAFSALMNKKAAELGANDTHFVNPHGLDQSGHYSSAYDLAVIGRELMKDPVLAKMVSTPHYSIPWPGHPAPRVAQNHNEILTQYKGATGIKTGYTVPAGWCLVASATRDGKSLIAAVLNSAHRADDAAALFNYGFSATDRIVLVAKGAGIGTTRVSAFPRRYVTVVPQAEMAALTFRGSGDVFKVKASVERTASSPVKKGETLGKIEALLNDAPLEKGNAVAARSQSSSNFLGVIYFFFWYSLCWTGKILGAPFRIF
jgi:D-alanyl-D-alanine carboxypeptidase (penicillin-binding protein 5/6)